MVTLLSGASHPSAAEIDNLCSVILDSRRDMGMLLNPKDRWPLALPVLLRNHSAPPYPTASGFVFPLPLARCPRMSTWASEETRHSCLLHKWDTFCAPSEGEPVIMQIKTAQPPHPLAPSRRTVSLPSGSAPLCHIYSMSFHKSELCARLARSVKHKSFIPCLFSHWFTESPSAQPRLVKENMCWMNSLKATTAAW